MRKPRNETRLELDDRTLATVARLVPILQQSMGGRYSRRDYLTDAVRRAVKADCARYGIAYGFQYTERQADSTECVPMDTPNITPMAEDETPLEETQAPADQSAKDSP